MQEKEKYAYMEEAGATRGVDETVAEDCGNNPIVSGYAIHEVIIMDKKQEKQQQKKSNEEFNSVTQKVKVENQNQEHNVRKEGIAPVNQKR